MCYVLKRGTTSRCIFIEVRDSNGSRAPVTGLTHRSAGASAAFIRSDGSSAQPIPLVAGKLGQHVAGGFVEIDATLMPGLYQLGVPDAALALGAESALVVVRFAGTEALPVEIALVAYDPQDEDRLGMSAIGPEGRIAALRGAFPRLTARELIDDNNALRRA